MTDPREKQGVSLEELCRALSDPRLSAYRRHLNEPMEVAIGRYRWNMALSSSLHPVLHLLEVSLRNNLHQAISDLHRTSAWYDIVPSVLTPQDQDSIAKAKAYLRGQRKPEEPGRMVAELSFGFWTGLLSRNYEQRLWPRLLRTVFPKMHNRQRIRKVAVRRFKAIRDLRNRVSHYEPIYNNPNLLQLYDEILDALGWLSPAPAYLLPVVEDFREIYRRGSAAYEIPVGRAPEGAP